MSPEMMHDELEGLVPLLALDALGAPDELAVRTHLRKCRTCSALLREHLETAAHLALLAGPAAPPGALKQRLMAQVAAEPQIEPAPERRTRLTDPMGPATPAGGARRIAMARWQKVVATFAAAACIVLGAAYYRNAAHIERQNEVIAQQKEILAVISGQPAMTLRPTEQGAGATGHVFVKDDKAALVLTGLDGSAKGVYEVWVIEDGKPSPLKAVDETAWQRGGEGEAVLLVDASVRGADGMAVSLEPSEPPPDSPGPRGPIILRT